MSDTLHRQSRPIDNIGDWLDQRRGHITASRVGALWDQHPYLTRDQLAGELRGQSVKGQTTAMKRGVLFEAAVIEALRLEHPDWRIERARTYHWLPGHRLGATPDAYLDDDGLIECKTVHPAVWEKWHGAPPLQYLLQTLTGLLVTGRTRGLLACMIMGADYPVYEYDVPRHLEAEARILEATAAWWEAWDKGEIAAPAPVEELEAMLDDGSSLDWSGNEEVRQLLEQRRELKATASITAQRLGEVEYKIKNFMGPASMASLPCWSITFKRTHRREYTVPAADVRTLRIKETTIE